MDEHRHRGLAELDALQLAYELHAPEPDRGAAIVSLIAMHFPSVDLSEHVAEWTEVDGELYLVLNLGHTILSRHGDDLHLAEPVEGGKVVCRVVHPDGSYEDTEADDPYSVEAAAWN